MLEAREGVRVVGEAGDVEEAACLAAETDASLVFLDVRLRGETGFELLDRLPDTSRVVFVTAYDEHAVRAFEVNALDYLLKPVTGERLDAALARASDPAPGGERKEPPPRFELDDHLFLRLDGSWRFVRVADVRCVLASGDYTRLVTRDGAESLVGRSLKDWEARLPSSTFLRIHRSSIVNLEHVSHVDERRDGSCTLHLRGHEEPLRMSRRYASRIRDRMS